ncbi:MAG TPA: hypothetical protein VHY91_11470 [Pirellulales bacterium]|jgi:hypothetical protein|nr:hypothetical protein [Pirellulales bacterium]
MNYFAHGRQFVDDPYFLAGTAVPDWLNVVDRSTRVRSRQALEHVGDPDPHVAAVARGIARHCHDDAWFHATRAFAELSLELTVQSRTRLNEDAGFRPHFIGHILVEILLDAALIAADPDRLEAWYRALDRLEADRVARAVGQMGRGGGKSLAIFIPKFSHERFLWDYLDDDKLMLRLNQVMRRVELPCLPADFARLLPTARRLVSRRQDELLTVPTVESRNGAP